MKPKSDLWNFLEPLADEIQHSLLKSDYSGVAELWESYDFAMLELREIAPVLELMRHHDKTWHDEGQLRWLMGLVEEVGELSASMTGKHDDPIEWEVMQIASIALNWLRLHSCNSRMQAILERKVSANNDDKEE